MPNTSLLSSWPLFSTISYEKQDRIAPQTYALDLLFAVLKIGLNVFASAEIKTSNLGKLEIGRGGFYVVERGQIQNQLVAVKRSRIISTSLAADNHDAFRKHLEQLSLEVRILAHPAVKEHPNIVDALGISIVTGDPSSQPAICLVLEYAPLGNLKAFLLDNQLDLPVSNLFQLAQQIAQGLLALHTCNICHVM